jgi:hypothetical protein
MVAVVWKQVAAAMKPGHEISDFSGLAFDEHPTNRRLPWCGFPQVKRRPTPRPQIEIRRIRAVGDPIELFSCASLR